MARVQKDSKYSPSYFTAFIRWLRLKNYQYEVTTSLYMLNSTEKFVFNSIFFILVSLLVTAAFFYLPNHLYVIYSRILYYISGDFVTTTSAFLPDKVAETLRGAKEVAVSQTIEAVASNTLKAARSAVTNTVRDEI